MLILNELIGKVGDGARVSELLESPMNFDSSLLQRRQRVCANRSVYDVQLAEVGQIG